jgi:RNA polymerase primary sigma factor
MREFKIINRITNTSDNLTRYFNEISKYEILSPEKEAELSMMAKNGDAKAKDVVLKSNLRFVVSVAKSYVSSHSPLEDLISEGNKGLVEAIENFDPTNGFKFISYAVWHIRKNILLYLNNYSRAIRIPTNVNQEMRKYHEIEGAFISYNGREPSIEEMLEIIENPESGLQISNNTLETIKNNPVSIPLENYGSDNEESISPLNWLQSSDNTDGVVMDEDLRKTIMSVISELKPMEKEITILKYGLGESKEPMSYKAIGEKMERTPEWARGVSKKAEMRMKVIIRRRKIKGLFFN